ncbi:MAG: hypothetical protein QG608_949 [Actinomycetota bacterium]|nr:hypothetical protein [Actinomycetota bacterium]
MTDATGQSYDPYILVEDVVKLLRSHGLSPDSSPGHLAEAAAGAGKLLRALDIAVAQHPDIALRRSGTLMWGESQDV